MNVARLQAGLAAAGYAVAADGAFGPATLGALMMYAAQRPTAVTLFGQLAPATLAQFESYGIGDDLERIHWIAQGCHETERFQFFTELGGPTYFSAYDGRKDLGNTEPGDGYRYRGRGIFQITGRYNYQAFGAKLGLDLVDNPDLAADPATAARIACEFWEQRDIGALARADDIEGVTHKINGGLNGLADRQAVTTRLKQICGLA